MLGNIGVSFQPGAYQGNGQQNGQNGQGPLGGGAVQEAIKILSLRLPKVVGAQAAAPSMLLTSAGSGGNPRVDSVVDRIMRRMLPGSAPNMPLLGADPFSDRFSEPRFTSAGTYPNWLNAAVRAPRVSFGTGDTRPPAAPPAGPSVPRREDPSIDYVPQLRREAPSVDYVPGSQGPQFTPVNPPNQGPSFDAPLPDPGFFDPFAGYPNREI